MRIRPINERVSGQANRCGLMTVFQKQLLMFMINPRHPGLHTEKLEPKNVGLYSFRIDRKFRAIFRIRDGQAEIITISRHYET